MYGLKRILKLRSDFKKKPVKLSFRTVRIVNDEISLLDR